jgi:hypothetical protein
METKFENIVQKLYLISSLKQHDVCPTVSRDPFVEMTVYKDHDIIISEK